MTIIHGCNHTLIIRHDAHPEGNFYVATEEAAVCNCDCSDQPWSSRLRSRLPNFSLSPCFQPATIRLSDGAVLLRGGTEEWQDGISFRPATASNMRSRAVFARGLCSLLVSQPPSRATNGHLVLQVWD